MVTGVSVTRISPVPLHLHNARWHDQALLELVVDIKNNKAPGKKGVSPGGGSAGHGGSGGARAVLGPSVLKWLKQVCCVEEVQLRSVNWTKLLAAAAGEKKGARREGGCRSKGQSLGLHL